MVMARNIARRRALLVITAGVTAFTAGCGTVQQFDPAPEHLRTIEGNRDVPPAVTQLPAPPAPVPRPPQETYSVVVTDVPVRDVLFALARDAGVNVDVSGDLQGNVTINAIDQTLPQILDRISRQASIRYSLDNATLVVLPDAPYWQNYRVDYVNLSRTAEGEVTVATQIATAGGSVGEDEESGGDESESNGSKTIVKNISENAFWSVLRANLRQLITGRSQAAEGETDGPDPVVINPMSGMVSVQGTGVQHRQIQEYLDQLSAGAKRQVLIEITVVEVNLSDQYQAGVDWATVSSQGGLGSDGVSLISDLIGGNLAAAPVFTGTYNNFEADGSGFSATVKLLSQFGDAKVLSTPRIMALNNQTALLKVVDELVYFTLTSETIESTGPGIPPRTIITSEINTVPVGFVMSVTPQISENGNVSLNVRPTLTRVIDFVVDPAPRLAGSDFDNLVPQLKVSEIESLLEVADGQTVVIGGLMQDRTSKQTDGIPYLSRIPLVGDLFSFRNDEVTKSELVLFLRPTVIRGAGVGQEGLASTGVPLPAATQAASGEVAQP
jgi:general secretion pathway protein D